MMPDTAGDTARRSTRKRKRTPKVALNMQESHTKQQSETNLSYTGGSFGTIYESQSEILNEVEGSTRDMRTQSTNTPNEGSSRLSSLAPTGEMNLVHDLYSLHGSDSNTPAPTDQADAYENAAQMLVHAMTQVEDQAKECSRQCNKLETMIEDTEAEKECLITSQRTTEKAQESKNIDLQGHKSLLDTKYAGPFLDSNLLQNAIKGLEEESKQLQDKSARLTLEVEDKIKQLHALRAEHVMVTERIHAVGQRVGAAAHKLHLTFEKLLAGHHGNRDPS